MPVAKPVRVAASISVFTSLLSDMVAMEEQKINVQKKLFGLISGLLSWVSFISGLHIFIEGFFNYIADCVKNCLVKIEPQKSDSKKGSG